MHIALVRHGVAERTAAGGADEGRELTPEGRHRLEVEARFLAQSVWLFDHILSSPLIRARQTAEVLGETLGRPVEVEKLLRPGMTADDVLEVASRFDGRASIILVAHQPDLSIVARELSGADLGFDEGAVAILRVADPSRRSGQLEAFLRGEAMANIGGS